MRILHVITSLDPRDGGPPVVAERLAAAQAALGHRVGLLSYADPAPEAVERVRKSTASVPGFDRVDQHGILPDAGAFGAVRAPNLKAWLSVNLPEFDYIHMHGIWNPILPHVATAARKLGKPYALVPHGMLDPWCLTGQGFAKATKKRLALALVYKKMIDGASFLHVLNADEGRLMQPLALKPPTVILPNGVFESEVSPLPPAGSFRAKRPELGNDPYILFLSRLHFKKGLDYLADAFAEVLRSHPTARLVVAGPDDGMVAPMTEQLQKLGAIGRTHFVGPLYGQDKLAAFVDCAVFTLPSRQEGFSMAITEALSCRRPVVISDQCHFPEVAENKAGYVVPVGASPTAAALREALSLSAAEAAAMGERGRELIMSRFTWPKIAERTLEAYAKHPARR